MAYLNSNENKNIMKAFNQVLPNEATKKTPIYSNNKWSVYRANSHEELIALASGEYGGVKAIWDITREEELAYAIKNWTDYAKDNIFYVAVAPGKKFAILVDKTTGDMSIYSHSDYRVADANDFLSRTKIDPDIFKPR